MKSLGYFVLSLWMVFSGVASHAQTLRAEKVGIYNVVISDSNRWIYVRPVAKLQVLLMEHLSLPESKRYSINLNGEVVVDQDHADLALLKTKYPGYQLEFAKASPAVEACDARLTDGTRIECSSPPATGNYFSGLQMLSQEKGSFLRAAIKNGGGIQISLRVREETPALQGAESFSFAAAEVCRSVGPAGASVSIEHLMTQVGSSLASQLLRVKSESLARQVLARAMLNCASLDAPGAIEDLSGVRSFADLLDKRVVLRASPVGVETLTRQEIAMRTRSEVAPVVIQYRIEEGK